MKPDIAPFSYVLPPSAAIARWQRRFLVGICLACATLLFVGGADLFHTRSFKYAWDLGHIVAGFVWTLLLLHAWPRLTAASYRRQVLVLLLVCGIGGGMIEVLQGSFGRLSSWSDMGRNIIGCLLTLAFLAPKRHTLARPWRRCLQIGAVGLLLIAALPLALALIDEWTAWRRFPVLSDFETAFEKDRWSGNATLSIDNAIVRHGQASLRIDLTTARYSGAALNYFPGDWRGWHAIAFSIYNPDPEPLRLTCKINDRRHDISGYRYTDRFNRSLVIAPGWHRVRIPLAEVANAPLGRRMDLGRITEFNLFTVDLTAQRTIYLDDLALEPPSSPDTTPEIQTPGAQSRR